MMFFGVPLGEAEPPPISASSMDVKNHQALDPLRLNPALSLEAPSLRSKAVPFRVIDGTRRAVKPLLSFEVS